MTVELTDQEKAATKLKLGAMFAARAFLLERNSHPTVEQAERIAGDVAPIIDRLVKEADIDSPECDFAELINRCAVAGIGVAAQVMNLAPRPFAKA